MTLKRTRTAGAPRLWVPRPFRILALDPGGTTGWAYCKYDGNPELDFEYTSGHLGPNEHHSDLFEFVTGLARLNSPNDAELQLVCESFEFRQHINHGGAKTKVELISKEYIGITTLIAEQLKLTLKFQTASAAKTLIPDKGPQANEKLKLVGVYKPVTSWVHAMDAMRHLLRYQVAEMNIRKPITDKWL